MVLYKFYFCIKVYYCLRKKKKKVYPNERYSFLDILIVNFENNIILAYLNYFYRKILMFRDLKKNDINFYIKCKKSLKLNYF